MSETQQSIAQALAAHSLAEIEQAVRAYRNAVLSPTPAIAEIHSSHSRLGLTPIDIASDLQAADQALSLQRDLEAVSAKRDAARPIGTIAAAREARADLDARADDLEAAVAAARRKAPRLFAPDMSTAAAATPRAAEVRAWAGRGIGAGRTVPTATQE